MKKPGLRLTFSVGFTVVVYRVTAVVALVFSAYCLLDEYLDANLGSAYLPLQSLDLGWLIPCAIACFVTFLIFRKKAPDSQQENKKECITK